MNLIQQIFGAGVVVGKPEAPQSNRDALHVVSVAVTLAFIILCPSLAYLGLKP